MAAVSPAASLALLALLASPATAEDPTARDGTCAPDTSGSTAALAVGERGVLALSFRCDPGIHLQARAPFRATLSATPGLALGRDRLAWADAADSRPEAPRFEVAFTAAAPGAQAATVHLAYFLCSRTWCLRQEREVEVRVEVAARSAP
jgi:hypothetical protein